MPLQAIQTSFNGHLFRSRLEARWAVFFTALGIDYRYEPEGFDLGGGVKYLPDFYLPKQRTWIEIKPVVPSGRDAVKVAAFAMELWRSNTAWDGAPEDARHQEYLLLAGDCWPEDLRSYSLTDLVVNGFTYNGNEVIQCLLCQRLISVRVAGDRREISPPRQSGYEPYDPGPLLTNKPAGPSFDWRYRCEWCDSIDRSWVEGEDTQFHKGDIYCGHEPFGSTSAAFKEARMERFGT